MGPWGLCERAALVQEPTTQRGLTMFARTGAWQGAPDALVRWISRAREQVKPSVQQDPGLKAAYWLVDREGGKGF